MRFPIVSLAIALTACAGVGYKPAGLDRFGGETGHRDRALEKDRFEISVRGDGFDSHEKLEGYFRRRAGELYSGRAHTDTIERTYMKRPSVFVGSSVSWPVVRGLTACAPGG